MPRNKYIVIALAPLFLLTPLGVTTYVLRVLPFGSFFFLLQNVAGSAGDIVLVLFLSRVPSDAYVYDEDTRIVFRDVNGKPILKPRRVARKPLTSFRKIVDIIGSALVLSIAAVVLLEAVFFIVAEKSFTIQVADIPLISCEKTGTELSVTVHPALFLTFFMFFSIIVFLVKERRLRD